MLCCQFVISNADNFVANNNSVVPFIISIDKNQYVTTWHDFGIYHCMETSGTSLKSRIEEIEKEEIIKALKECNWVMARAAKMLGITERMIGYKIHKYGLRIKEVRWSEGAAEEHDSGNERKEPH